MNNTPDSMSLFDDAGRRAGSAEDTDSPEIRPNQDPVDPAAADKPADASDSEPTVEQPPQEASEAEAPLEPAASSASRTVGSEAEMDAWLSQSASDEATGAWLPTDAAADAAMAAWLAADPNAAAAPETPVVVAAGKVDRVRPSRRQLVPRWLPWLLLGVLLVGGITAGVLALSAARSRVIVPTLAGLQTQAARERLATVGLTLTVSDRRFSTLPIDTVLSQTPDVGSLVRRGSSITVIVSAGTEEFTMLDVVGMGLTLAKTQLEQKGLQVQVEPQVSDQPSDTVLASNPAAGSPMHTGDIVKLTVATGSTSGTSQQSPLVPYTMTGVKITLDPAAPVAGQPDSALEVSRRLQSLLEASGATVLATRSTVDTGTTASSIARQARAREGSATVAVGLDVVSTGEAGLAVNYPSSAVATATAATSQQLASQIASAFAGSAFSARQTAGGSDVVLSVTNAPYARITLGSTASPEDLANFRDPGWADKIARAIYQGIAAIYGVKNTTTP